jgi:3'(2'), 5'-bisphosphate nucleotidase
VTETTRSADTTIDLTAFRDRMKAVLLQAGAVAVQLQEFIDNIGKAVDNAAGAASKRRSILTLADLAIQELVLTAIRTDFPRIRVVIAEEVTKSLRCFGRSGRYRFVIDPIDGTAEYLEGGGSYGILTGLIDVDKCVAAVLHYPALDTFYWALKHEGSFVEICGKRTKLQCKKSTEKVLAIEINERVDVETRDALSRQRIEPVEVWDATPAILRVVEGTSRAYACHTRNMHDIALAGLIVEEAGGTVCNWDGSEILYPYNTATRIPRFLVCSDGAEDVTTILRHHLT